MNQREVKGGHPTAHGHQGIGEGSALFDIRDYVIERRAVGGSGRFVPDHLEGLDHAHAGVEKGGDLRVKLRPSGELVWRDDQWHDTSSAPGRLRQPPYRGSP